MPQDQPRSATEPPSSRPRHASHRRARRRQVTLRTVLATLVCAILVAAGLVAATPAPAQADAVGGASFGAKICIKADKCISRGKFMVNTDARGNQLSGQSATWNYIGALCNWRLDWVLLDLDNQPLTTYRGVNHEECVSTGHADLFNAADTERAPQEGVLAQSGKICSRLIGDGLVRVEHCNALHQATVTLRSMHGIAQYVGAACLDADLNTIHGNGTKIQLWACNESTQQQWVIGPDGTIRSAYDPRMCLDADLNTLASNPTRVQLWECNGSQQQQWRFVGSGKGRYLKNVLSGKFLDADLNTIGSNAVVQLWTGNGQIQQRWY